MDSKRVFATSCLVVLAGCAASPPDYEANLYKRLRAIACHGIYPEGCPVSLKIGVDVIRPLQIGTFTDPVESLIWGTHFVDPHEYPHSVKGINVEPAFSPDDAPRLVEHLADKHVYVRWAFAVELRQIADHRVVPALIERLRAERDYSVRQLLAMALGNAKDPRAIPVLVEVARNPVAVNEMSTIAKERETLQEWEDLATDAKVALGKIPHKAAFDALVTLQKEGFSGLYGLEASPYPEADRAIEELVEYYAAQGEKERSEKIFECLENKRKERREKASSQPGSTK